MESLETQFEQQYSLDAISGMSLNDKEFILKGLQMVQVFTSKKNWEAGYYYEKEISGYNGGIEVNIKKFLAKLYMLEEKADRGIVVNGLIRFLPGDISLLKLNDDNCLVFEHSELSHDNKVRRIRLIGTEEFVGTKKSLLEQIERNIQSLKAKIQTNENNQQKLNEL